MRLYIVIAALVAVVSNPTVGAENEDTNCLSKVENFCSTVGGESCNALYGGFQHGAETHLQEFLMLQLGSSFDYMRLATRFNSYRLNRPGFQKLMNGLSDAAWQNTIDLIKHITKRGGSADFAKLSQITLKKSYDINEYPALGMALDIEKELSNKAMDIHRGVSHAFNHETKKYDPEIAQYMEEEFLEDQAGTIRKLSGYANDLRKLLKTSDNTDPSLPLYLFDEYLSKQ